MIQNINELIKIIKNRKVYIYAVNLEGIGFLRLLNRNGIEIEAFIDSRKFKNNKKYEVKIINPDIFWKHYDKNRDFIIIATKYRSIKRGIIEKLKDLKSIKNQDYAIITELCPFLPTVEIVGSCNLNCPLCELNAPWSEKKPLMKIKDFKQVISKLKKEIHFFNSVYLYLWGEPTLHKEIDKIINIVHEYGLACDVSTNLNINKNLEKMILANPDILNIPCPGVKDKYEKYYKGGKWNIFIKNLYYVAELIEKNSLDIAVRIDYHVYKDNIDGLKEMKSVAEQLGFYLFPIMGTVFPGYIYKNIIENIPFSNQIKELSSDLLFSIDEQMEFAYKNKHKNCPFMNAFPVVRSDLSVNLCCNMTEPKIASNYLNLSLDTLIKIRTEHEHCQKCMSKGIHRFFDLGIKVDYQKNGKILISRDT